MKLPFLLLLLGCAITLSHQQRNYYGANMAKPLSYWPVQSKRHESQITIDENTAEDFSEFLIARQAYRVAQRSHPNPSSNVKPLVNSFANHHQQESLQADELNAFKSPVFRQNLDSQLEDFGAQSRNPTAISPENRPFPWTPLFGLLSPFDQSLDDDRARNYFNYFSSVGSTNGGGNPFMKTIYYFTTATATSCSFISCIPESFFAQSKSTVTCRRKKRHEGILKELETLDDLSPSPLEEIETSEMVSRDTFETIDSTPDQTVLKSSKDEVAPDDTVHYTRASPGRSKRLFNNFFVYSTTLTSYVFTVKTTTLTLTKIANNGELNCRPSGVVICQ